MSLSKFCNKDVYSINLLDSESINAMSSFGLVPVIDRPTYVTQQSATLIDNIFTNQTSRSLTGGIVVDDVSDHMSTFCLVKSIHTT